MAKHSLPRVPQLTHHPSKLYIDLNLAVYLSPFTDPVEVFDDASRKVGLHFDDDFNQFVEVVGTHFKYLQHPGEGPVISEIAVCSPSCPTTGGVEPSGH